MSEAPDISVVMGVYNEADNLRQTVDSVLAQEDASFELIAVDDGSTDASGAILDDYARHDSRVRVIHQENKGLTRALIAGCDAARGAFIARQDAGGDLSLPGRLATQLQAFRDHPEAVMVSCATRFVAPDGTHVQTHLVSGLELQERLTPANLDDVQGPSIHGSVMFRRDVYADVGGYRSAFRVAQDLDLWLRLAERGICWGLDEVLYQAVLRPNSISFGRRDEQVDTARTIVACAAARRAGGSDDAVLAKWGSAGRPDSRRRKAHDKRGTEARFYYFLGCVLAQRDPIAGQRYLWKALARRPASPRYLLRAAQNLVRATRARAL